MPDIVVALAGNPNAGKTTVFNALTGSRQHVGNYPGVTVEKKEGFAERQGRRFRIVDLPGTYSLSAHSPEEVVARNFLVEDKPDVVVQVVDSSNLERNLFLATQLMELGVRLVLAFNMADVAKAKGYEFDLAKLSGLLKAPIVPTVGNRRQGMDALLDAVAKTAAAPAPEYQKISYPRELEQPIAEIDTALKGKDLELASRYPEKWFATRLFENDADLAERVSDKALLARVAGLRAAFETENEDPPEIRIAESKYGWISGLCAESAKMTPVARSDMSDKVDAVLLHRILGIPIFLGMMYVMFQLVFTLAEKPMEWIEAGFGALGRSVAELWPRAADSPLRDLLVDGIIGGVGGVLVFLPNIILLFLAIAFLEGTGYMARAAFIMDRFMNRIGLHGKSFIPMLLGFGCTVPAIMATRTLETRRDRLTTILVLPFMSCGARLPIYALLIPAFFPGYLQAWMLWIIYVVGIVFAIAGAKLLRATLFKGGSTAFVIELPPYRMPTLRSVTILMWDRAGEYCKKAGTIILGASIILWAMTAYPKKETFDRDYGKELETARAEYLAKTRELGQKLGIGEDGALLAGWAGAGMAKADAEAEFWEKEPGYAQAEAEYDKRLESLFAAPGGDKLKEFVDGLAEVDAIEEAFAGAVEGHEGGSPEYREAEKARAGALAELRLPEEFKTGVAAYRDGILSARIEAEEEIANGEEGEQLAYSVSGRVGRFIEPVLKPIGFDWRIGTAIIGSFAAKEVFVAQMGIVYSVGEADEESDSLRTRLRDNYTPLQAFCMMIYCLLSLPCVATIAVTRRETGGWRFAVFMMISLTVVAYVTTLVVFQAGSALGLGV